MEYYPSHIYYPCLRALIDLDPYLKADGVQKSLPLGIISGDKKLFKDDVKSILHIGSSHNKGDLQI